MSALVHFITHPDVQIDPAVPVPEWRLSARGRDRMAAMTGHDWVRGIGAIFSSTERKARDGAEILGAALLLSYDTHAGLGENDRSATGYLKKDEFEAMADAFFARPHESVRGWERAVDAQARVTAAMEDVLARAAPDRTVAVVAHGAVGALYLCHLKACAISRSEDQPPTGGGNYYTFERASRRLLHGWKSID